MAHHRYKYIVSPGWKGISGQHWEPVYSNGSFPSRRIAKAAFKGHPIYAYTDVASGRSAINRQFPFWNDTPGENPPTKAVRYGR